MENEGTNKNTGESDHLNKMVATIEKKRGFYQSLMGNVWDAEELKQETALSLIKKYTEEPNWLEEIENIDAYVVRTAKNIAFNIFNAQKIRPVKYQDSIDDEANVSIKNNLSDGGDQFSQINQEIDYQPYRKQMMEILKSKFSKYERTLIRLKMFEGCKPLHIVKILRTEYPSLLKAEYPELSEDSDEETVKKITEFVQDDCNLAEAKFRQYFKKIIKQKV